MDQSVAFLALVVIGVWILIRKRKNNKFRISHEEAKQLLNTIEGIILLDVRTEAEHREKHIPGSLLIPLNDLQAQAEKSIPDKKTEILVYCRNGSRSNIAVRILLKLGYENVRNIGGISDWPYETFE